MSLIKRKIQKGVNGWKEISGNQISPISVLRKTIHNRLGMQYQMLNSKQLQLYHFILKINKIKYNKLIKYVKQLMYIILKNIY